MKLRHLLATATLCAAHALSQAQTTEVAGVKYDNARPLSGATLHLNGAGIRYKAIFKVYTAGLYLMGKAATPEAVFAMAGPKSVHVVMLREIDGNELGKLFTRGMQDNSSREEFAKSIPGTVRMGEIFATRKKLLQGDSFSVDYVPGTGTTVLVNGKPQGEPIKEPEFFNSLLRIWLGHSPADAGLKSAMLGQASTATRPNDRF
ncbi:MAG: chalcone isomerase family protein [Burkholderiales bacterium]|nr:chalcone isomerase family protein [Burkholderiales bacterium]